jgi:hypothetical protein
MPAIANMCIKSRLPIQSCLLIHCPPVNATNSAWFPGCTARGQGRACQDLWRPVTSQHPPSIASKQPAHSSDSLLDSQPAAPVPCQRSCSPTCMPAADAILEERACLLLAGKSVAVAVQGVRCSVHAEGGLALLSRALPYEAHILTCAERAPHQPSACISVAHAHTASRQSIGTPCYAWSRHARHPSLAR